MSEIMEEELINKLPDECLQHIFSFLPVLKRLEAEKVCKRWYTISKRGWNDTKKLEISRCDSDDVTYPILKRCGRFLRKLTIHPTLRNFNCLSMVTKCCRFDQLEAMEIRTPLHDELKFDPPKLREIFEKATKLVAVKVVHLNSEDVMDYLNFLNPMILEKLELWSETPKLSINPDRFPNLKVLDLANSVISEDEMKREDESLKKLEKLEIAYCELPETFLERIGTFTNLQEFEFVHNNCDISDENIQDIAIHCLNLREIALSYSDRLTSDCFEYLESILSLEKLTLHDLRDENVKSLYSVNYSDIIGDELIDLIANSSNLGVLALIGVPGLSKSFMNDVGEIFHSGQRQKSLRFYVSSCDYSGEIRMMEGGPADHPLLDWQIDE